MATNKPTGDNRRQGAVRRREQIKNPKTDHFTKIDADSGKFMDNKSNKNSPFKGVRKK
jgi:hypothetical protein